MLLWSSRKFTVAFLFDWLPGILWRLEEEEDEDCYIFRSLLEVVGATIVSVKVNGAADAKSCRLSNRQH